MVPRRKGMAFETIGFFMLGIIGLFIMLDFLGVINISVNNIFCSTYAKIGEVPAFCESDVCTSERQNIQTSDPEEFARDIAAHAIACYHNKAGCLQEDNVRLCYALIPKMEPDDEIGEYEITQILENEGGCEVLENSKIVGASGNYENYDGNCGMKDSIDWRVDDITIKSQPIILIEYNEINSTVMVKA